MRCVNCGAVLPDGAMECEYCATPVPGGHYQNDGADFGKTIGLSQLLNADELNALRRMLSEGKNADAQRYLNQNFNIGSGESFAIISSMLKNVEPRLASKELLLENLTDKTKSVFFFGSSLETAAKAKSGAVNKYLTKLGYSNGEYIELLFDNAVFKSGESGFVLTHRGFYSSGGFLIGGPCFIPMEDIKTVVVSGASIVVNDKKAEIEQADARDYIHIGAILLRSIRGL